MNVCRDVDDCSFLNAACIPSENRHLFVHDDVAVCTVVSNNCNCIQVDLEFTELRDFVAVRAGHSACAVSRYISLSRQGSLWALYAHAWPSSHGASVFNEPGFCLCGKDLIRAFWNRGLPTHCGHNTVNDGVYFLFKGVAQVLSLIHISEPTRQAEISYAVF